MDHRRTIDAAARLHAGNSDLLAPIKRRCKHALLDLRDRSRITRSASHASGLEQYPIAVRDASFHARQARP